MFPFPPATNVLCCHVEVLVVQTESCGVETLVPMPEEISVPSELKMFPSALKPAALASKSNSPNMMLDVEALPPVLS